MTQSFKATCIRDNLKLIREFVLRVLNKQALNDIEINQLVLAVDEICANLIIHAHHCNPDEVIEVIVYNKENQIIFEITNHDQAPFDLSAYQNPSLDAIVQQRRKGGLGLVLVHKIMDQVEVNVDDAKCTWRLVKDLTCENKAS